MKTIYNVNGFNEVRFISPGSIYQFDKIIKEIDFRCNDHTYESFKEYLTSPIDEVTKEWKIFLAVSNNEIIGITGWYILKNIPDTPWLTWFGIIEKYQHLHAGSAILKHTIDTVKEERGAKEFYVYCIDDIVPFYTKNKFKLLGNAKDLNMVDICEDDSDNILVYKIRK